LKIGIVLSKPPTYSETFFNSKIEGLQNNGFEVVLFVQKKDSSFTLCKTKSAPKVYTKNIIFQLFNFVLTVVKLLCFPMQVYKFIKLERLVNRSWKQIFKNLYNNSHILTTRLDWVHFGFVTMALQSEHVAKAIQAKMAVSLRGFDIDVFPLSNKNAYRLLWQQVDRVHSISNYLLIKAYHLGLTKDILSRVITPGLSILKFSSENLKYSEPIEIVTIARLHWIKGLSYTLEALAVIKKTGIDFKYTIIGSGSQYEELAFAIHELGLTENVLLTGQIPHNEISNRLSNGSIYLQYSQSEGFCNATLEAQALGLLCIVSDGGALKENVIHEESGWIVPKRNPVALAKKIIEVIHLSEVEKQKVSQQAQSRVKEYFSLKDQEQQFIAFYEKDSNLSI
jgi:colanic acid/amylovoran biosynthesis glycosyltransferase